MSRDGAMRIATPVWVMFRTALTACFLIGPQRAFAVELGGDPDAGPTPVLESESVTEATASKDLSKDGTENARMPLENDPSYTTVIVAKRPYPLGTVSRIDNDEIALRGARNLPEALALEPGVEVNQSPKAGSTLQIRGSDERSVLLMFEGIPIREVYDGHFDIASLPVFSFDSLELEKGVTSPLFGPNSGGGILQLNAPTKCSDIYDINLFGRASAKDAALYGGRAKTCTRIPSVTLFAGIGYEHSAGYPLSDSYETNEYNAPYHEDGSTRDGSDYERASISFLAKYAPRRHKNLNLFVDAVHSPRSIPPFEGYGYLRYWRFVSYNTVLAGVSGTYGLDNPPPTYGLREIKGHIYSHVHRDEIRDYEDTTYERLTTNSLAWFVASAYANETYGASVQGAWSLNRGNRLDLSLRYNLDLHKQREIPVPVEGAKTTWTSWERYSAHTFTAAIEDTQILGPWRLNAGFGASGMSLLAQEIRDKRYPVDKRVIPAFEGRIVAEYELLEGFRLMAAAGHKVRFPMLKELFSNSIGGNPDLNSERAWMAETGLDSHEILLKGLDTSIHVFGDAIRDLIENYRNVYANIGRSIIAGAELEIRYRPIDFLQFYSGYRYLYTRDLEHGKPLDYRTPHRVVLGERLFFRFGLTFALEAVFNSGQQAYYIDSMSGDWVEDTLPAYVLMNGHLRYERAVRPFATVYLYVDGANLMDVNYYVGSFEPRLGREVIIGIGSRM